MLQIHPQETPTATPSAPALEWQADDIVRRYCADLDRPLEDGRACFESLKQYLVVCAASDSILAPSQPIDEMWHTALLFTRAYADFCAQQFGRFIHHQPIDAAEVSAERYAEARRRARVLFGELDTQYWPDGVAGRCGSGGAGSIYVP